MKSLLFLAACLGFVADAPAQSLSSLAAGTDWHRLVLYEPDGGSASGVRSAIHSPDFFLSEQGATEPEAELQATLAAMLLPPSGTHDAHAKCRFPARRLWLQQRLPQQAAALAEIDCPAFAAWAQPDKIDSISLVFANGYLGNPASYYGHTFLKFNHSQASSTSSLLDSTLNYGAIDTASDDPVSYIVKGITGGYEGGFSPIEFYFHDATYGEGELRDLWEYRLALPEPAMRLIVAHAWEVTHKKYTYYFFRLNCAYRVAELIEIASGLDIIPRDRPWVMPQALIQKMARTEYAGKPLVGARIYHPSRQSRLYGRYTALSGAERTLTADIIDKTASPTGPQMRALPVQRQQAIIDTLLDYHQFRLEHGKHGPVTRSSPEYLAALNARYQLPPGDVTPRQAPPEPPDVGRAPSYVQAGVSHTGARGQGIELRIRPAYYDALDSGSAQARNSMLSMFDTTLAVEHDRWRIRRLDLLLIDSLNPAVTGLPGDQGKGWRLAVGIDEERAGCVDCRVTRAQGDIGIGRALRGTQLTAAVHVGGAAQAGARTDGWGFARAGASLVYRPDPVFGLRFAHEVRRPFRHRTAAYGTSQAEARLAVGTDYDLRLRWEVEPNASGMRQRVTLSVGRYW
jgi:hypothetical protein